MKRKIPRKATWKKKEDSRVVTGIVLPDKRSLATYKQINPAMHPMEFGLYGIAVYKIIQLLSQNITTDPTQTTNGMIQAIYVVVFAASIAVALNSRRKGNVADVLIKNLFTSVVALVLWTVTEVYEGFSLLGHEDKKELCRINLLSLVPCVMAVLASVFGMTLFVTSSLY